MPEYLLILLFLLAVSVFLHRHYKLKLFRSKLHLLICYVVFLTIEIIWDNFAIYRGHWSFGKRFLFGPHIGLMPIEELGFGLIVPYFALVLYKLVERYTYRETKIGSKVIH